MRLRILLAVCLIVLGSFAISAVFAQSGGTFQITRSVIAGGWRTHLGREFLRSTARSANRLPEPEAAADSFRCSPVSGLHPATLTRRAGRRSILTATANPTSRSFVPLRPNGGMSARRTAEILQPSSGNQPTGSRRAILQATARPTSLSGVRASGEWFILRSEDFSFFSFPFGAIGDIPAPADYDGDRKADAAVFRPSNATWFILNSGGSGTTIATFGAQRRQAHRFRL